MISIGLNAQQPIIYSQEVSLLDKANQQFEENLYSAASRSYQKVIDYYRKQDIHAPSSILAQAELGKARCSMKLNFVEAPSQLENAIKSHFPNPYSYDAVMDLGNYYYNDKKHEEAIHYFKLLDERQVPEEYYEEVSFKLGYSHFVKKMFAKAENYFSRPISKSSPYYTKNTYYSGMVAYFSKDYDTALKSFKKVEKNKEYKSHIPYYICQIYFAQGQYDELISYGSKLLKKSNVKKENEINLLLGQAYFIQKDYKKALPYLEYYEKNTKKLSEDEFYQLGFTQYKLFHYEDAIDNLIELSYLNNKMGVMSNYYLADSYMQVGDKVSARTAFKLVSSIDLVPSIQEEAKFNYAKLTAELGYDREAINNLMQFSDHSEYKVEAQSLLSQLLLHTSDYTNAIKTIEKLPSKTEILNKTLTKLYFLRALQLYNDGSSDDANKLFANVLNANNSPSYSQQARYYQALISYNSGDIDRSISLINQYLNTGYTGDLPDETNSTMANYLQANNYLKKKDYTNALSYYEKSISTSGFKNAELSKKISNESTVRAADCAFQLQKRSLAAKYYAKSIDNKDMNYDYSNYQLATIRGLEKKPYDKIVLLEKITNSDSSSDLVDDALMQLGDTYLSLQKFNKAFNAYKTIIKSHKGSNFINQAFLKLGLISYNQGDVQDALTSYKEIFNHNPNPKETQQALLSIQEIYVQDLGQAEEYLLFAEKTAGFKISDFAKDSLHYNIAFNNYKNGKYPIAVEKFDKYLNKYNKGFYQLPATYYRAESNTLLKNYSKALADYKKVIESGEGEYFKKSLRKAALISYNYAENFVDALKYYKLMTKNTDSPEIIHEAYLGALQSAYRTSNIEDVKHFATKLIQHPLVTQKEKTTAFFYSGKSYHQSKNFDQAIPSLNQVVRLSNNEQSAEAKYLLADIFFQKKLYDKAQKQCLDISDNTANYPHWVAKSLLLLADVLIKKSDFFNSKAALEAVIEHYQDDKEILNAAEAKLKIVKEQEKANSRVKDKGKEGELEME